MYKVHEHTDPHTHTHTHTHTNTHTHTHTTYTRTLQELRELLDALDMAQACYKRSVHAAAAYCAIKVSA